MTSLYPKLYLGLLLLTACTSEAKMRTELQHADSLGQVGRYTEALELLEGIRTNAASSNEEIREAIEQKNKWRLQEAEQELIRLDTELGALKNQIETLLKDFNPLGHPPALLYCHKHLTAEAQGHTPHLRAEVDTLGNLQLTSVFVGSKAIHHSALRLSSQGGTTRRTLDVPHDDAFNYRYADGEQYWELVTYSRTYLGELAPLDVPLTGQVRVELLSSGQSASQWTMDSKTKAALQATIQLQGLLAKRQSLRQEQLKYAQRFVRLTLKGSS